jgi:integrase
MSNKIEEITVKMGVNGGFSGLGSGFGGCAVSLLPHKPSVRNNTGGFYVNRHKKDTRYMGDFTKPKLNKTKVNGWFIYYNFMVPEPLRHLHSRGWKRFKVYAGINRMPVSEREKAAADIISELTLALRNGWLNPFEAEEEIIATPKVLTRTEMLCRDVLPLFMVSRIERHLDKTSISAYQSTVDWLMTGIADIPAGEVKYTDISVTINKVATDIDRLWGATTINKEWDFAQTVFNWMALEDYIIKNPLKGKVIKLPTTKTKHKWYDRETAIKVRRAILGSKTPWLINVCQFTYEILIRSKKELMNIKVGDIDMQLRRIYFRKEWTKNSADQYRDYSEAFHLMALKMKLDTANASWYVFSKGGKPGPEMCGHNYFSRSWEPIRDLLNLSDDYTVYGWKHTAIIHDMMNGVDGYTISHRARHADTKTTDDYKRDYDITLNKVYIPSDLLFWPITENTSEI